MCVCLSACLPVCLSVCVFVSACVCVCVCLCACLAVCEGDVSEAELERPMTQHEAEGLEQFDFVHAPVHPFVFPCRSEDETLTKPWPRKAAQRSNEQKSRCLIPAGRRMPIRSVGVWGCL